LNPNSPNLKEVHLRESSRPNIELFGMTELQTGETEEASPDSPQFDRDELASPKELN
jgi:hypothetical protein